VAIEDRTGQKKNHGAAIDFHAGQKKSYGAALDGSCQPKEKSRHGNWVLRRPLGKSRHSNRWIVLASWKITAQQSVDCAGHLKIFGGGLATISKGRDGLRKRQIWRSTRKNYDLGLCYSKDFQPCDNWESRMAVKRAAAVLRLVNPKRKFMRLRE
jgi:hypothetical protein